jgi:hypothetical protein
MKDSTMTVKAGELWIAEITFTDGSASKKRPVLIEIDRFLTESTSQTLHLTSV